MDNGKYKECIEAIEKGDYDKVKKLSFDDKKALLNKAYDDLSVRSDESTWTYDELLESILNYNGVSIRRDKPIWNELLENMFTTREEVLEIAKVSRKHVGALLFNLKKLSDEDKIEILGDAKYELNTEEKATVIASMADNKKKIEELIKIKKDFEPSGLVTVIASMTDNGITDLESMQKVLKLFSDKFKDKTEWGPSIVTIVVATEESNPEYHNQNLKGYKNSYSEDERYRNIELIPKDELKLKALKIFDELNIFQVSSIIISMKEDNCKLAALDEFVRKLKSLGSESMAEIKNSMSIFGRSQSPDSDDFANEFISDKIAEIIRKMSKDETKFAALKKFKDELKSDKISWIIILMNKDQTKLAALNEFASNLESHHKAKIIRKMSKDETKLAALKKFKDELKSDEISIIIGEMSKDETKLAALDEFASNLESHHIAKIISEMTKDETKFAALKKFKDELKSEEISIIIISMSKDETKLAALNECASNLESHHIAKIIRKMSKDEPKLAALEYFGKELKSYHIAEIIVSLISQENIYKACNMNIITSPQEKKDNQNLKEHGNESELKSEEIAQRILSMSNDEKKLVELGKSIEELNSGDIVKIIKSFKSFMSEKTEFIALTLYKDKLTPDDIFMIIALPKEDNWKFKELTAFASMLKSDYIAGIINSMNKDQTKLDALVYFGKELKSDEISIIIGGMSKDETKLAALDECASNLESHHIAKIISEMTKDETKFVALEKYKDELGSDDIVEIIFSMNTKENILTGLKKYGKKLESCNLDLSWRIECYLKKDKYIFSALSILKDVLSSEQILNIIRLLEDDEYILAALKECKDKLEPGYIAGKVNDLSQPERGEGLEYFDGKLQGYKVEPYHAFDYFAETYSPPESGKKR